MDKGGEGIRVGGEVVGGRRGVDVFIVVVEDKGVVFGYEFFVMVFMYWCLE